MSGHTPGPWVARRYLGRDDNWFVRGPRDERVCGQGSGPVSEANARRIVACVNALEGLDPAAVADVVAAAKNINLTFDSYGKERLPEYVRKEFAPLLAAIAKAEGGAA